MARSGNTAALVVLGGAALAAVALLGESDAEAEEATPQTPPSPSPPSTKSPPAKPSPRPPIAKRLPPTKTPVKPLGPDEASDDETALGRMLASEDHRERVKVVIGWLTVQRARARRISLYQLVTTGMGYGSQLRGDVPVYASTKWPPSRKDREIARGLLDGRIQPSEAIRKHLPGGWVQRRVSKQVSDSRLIALQNEWKEGIYGAIETTGWVLYSRDSPIISIGSYENASARLNALPKLPAIDKLLV